MGFLRVIQPSTAGSSSPSYATTHQRGMGVGLRSSLQALAGGATNWSLITRKVIQSKKPFIRCKVVRPTFYQPTAPFVDTEMTAKNFQWAIEPSAKPSTTGLAVSPKKVFLTNGVATCNYAGPGTNPKGYVESDWLYLDAAIPADTSFALYELIEDVAQAANAIPLDNQGGSSFVNRYEGSVAASTSQLGTLLTLDSVTAFSTNPLGGSSATTPAFLIIDYDETDVVVGIDGDSTNQGVGEGNTGSGTTDILGTAKGNSGWAARGINEKLGLNYAVNIAKASDGTKYKALQGAMRFRMSILRKANPNRIYDGDGINDMSGNGTNRVKTWAVYNVSTNYTYNRGDVVVANSNLYICVRGGNPATTGTGPSGTTAFTEITDNQCRWVYLLPDTSPGRTAVTAYAGKLIKYDQYREILPGIKISTAMVGPLATSSDSFATVANQTPSYTPVTGARDLLNGLFRRQSTDPTLGVSAFYDLNTVLEYNDGSGTPTGKWAVAADRTATTGTANFYTADGTHQNGNGHAALGAAMPTTLFT